MDLFEHEKECVRLLGRPWTEVHVFLDQYSAKFRGFLHRRLLHHRLGIEAVVMRFGDGARHAAELHVEQDLGFVPKDWRELDEYCFFLGDEESLMEAELRRLYGVEVFDEVENQGI